MSWWSPYAITATTQAGADRLQYLYGLYLGAQIYVPVIGEGAGGDVTPSAPSPTPSQQTLPTSKYGSTIPVVYGICRIPGAYIWAPDFDKDATGGTVVTTLRARIRFARPLVADSNWRVRRLWADGLLIANYAEGYQSPKIGSIATYDGQSTQERDPLQVDVEGETNVSAHRGYLDIVIVMDLDAGKSQPPAFDAEWVQDPVSSTEEDSFISFTSDDVDTFPAANWPVGVWYGVSIVDPAQPLLRKFNINQLHEVFSIPFTGLGGFEPVGQACSYVSEVNRLILVVSDFLQPLYPALINPSTGAAVAIADDPCDPDDGEFSNATCVVMTGAKKGLYFHSSYVVGYFSAFSFTASTITRVWISTDHWDGAGDVLCMIGGEIRTADFDLWVVNGTTSLFKMKLKLSGAIVFNTSFATLADNGVYCVYFDGDVIVWDDNNGLIRIDGSTGSTVWSTTVPYQIGSGLNFRTVGDPDHLRLGDGTFLFSDSSAYHMTDLNTGVTTAVTGAAAGSTMNNIWDAITKTAIRTSVNTEPVRIRFDLVGDGTIRDLDDFIAAVWETDEDFSASEHDEVNIDDQINGAVIDITTGKRDVIRSCATPYSFSIFERSAEIITKRALTDGSFITDATITSADIADRSGQAIKATKSNPEEFIARFGITYRDPVAIYQALTQYGEIQFTPFPISPTDTAVKQDVPVIASATRMKTLATKKVQRLAEEKHVFSMKLRAKFLPLEPEDILSFSYANRTIDARVLEGTINPDFTVDVRSTEFLSKVDATVAGSTGRPTEPHEVGSPESSYYHLDIPLLSDSDDLEGSGLLQYHVLTSQGQEFWDGATLYRDNVPVSSQTEDGLVGVALSALPDWDIPYVTEFTRSINVSFITGDTSQLASATYQEVCEGANRFAIGAPGRWEICHVIDITDNGDGTWTFEGLRRGRGVSEEHTASHLTGDYVVWLAGTNVQNLDYAIADLNDSFTYKPVGFGGNLTTTTGQTETITGEAEKIPKPCHLAAEVAGSDIDLSWVRRSRVGSFWAEDGDDTYTTPLGESLEQYIVRILDGPGGTQLRSYTVNDVTTKTYPAADITSDFGSIPAELTFTVRQVSGTGVVCPTREETITL